MSNVNHENDIEQAIIEEQARIYREQEEEKMYKVTVECTWTRCNDGTHLPEKSDEVSEYLTIDETGHYRVLCYLPTIGFFDEKNEYKNILGYVKLSDINVFKAGERNA